MLAQAPTSTSCLLLSELEKESKLKLCPGSCVCMSSKASQGAVSPAAANTTLSSCVCNGGDRAPGLL